ncbi:SWIM zinc finger family protein [Streptomyces bambusae]|uniref:SWIM zinc finger family protein n=1 Tax=Streptomyces bambusae TaxID=1550616 RepID=UPI001CFF26EE|nr:SWIM zinc finger family protein [Streptomyces bambusae]MCB5165870.1 SWIM zinc finger family protein [Streptomyces bambusae]
MTDQAVRWTAEQVLSLAPDDTSRKAGTKLGSAGPWSGAGHSGSGAVWGLCKGSGSRPYQTVVDLTGPAYKCSCPSRKFPCKHALGLLLLWAADEGTVPAGEAPEWAGGWLGDRAQRSERKKEGGGAGGGKPVDEAAARRRAERRAGRIDAGVAELEQRLADLLRGGLAGQEQAGYRAWEETAARMVDAQAPGLAARVRELGTLTASGPGWPVRMLEECALLHLLDRAWQGVAELPAPLAATVRTRVGLPGAVEGAPVADRWLVLAQYDTVSPDGRLTTRRVWLQGEETGRPALVLDFGPPGRAPQLALPVGLVVRGEAAFHAGAVPLRADLVGRDDPPGPPAGPPPGVDTGAALDQYGAALRRDPWLDSWPVVLAGVIPVPADDGNWQLADADGTYALPLSPGGRAAASRWQLAALSGGAPLTVFGECGHTGFTPLTAWQPDSPAAVPLV